MSMLATNLPFATPKTENELDQALWEHLVPLLAGRPRVRISRDNGANYRQRDERDLPAQLPSRPAAVMLHDTRTGRAQVLAIDFDAKDNRDRVDLDVRRIQDLLTEFRMRWIHDSSPSGGQHLYVPVAGGISAAEAVDTLKLMATTCTSIDYMPHNNVLHGCIRMPGSTHKLGPRQKLLMSLGMALNVASNPAPRHRFDALRASLEHLRPAPAPVHPHSPVVPASESGHLSKPLLDIARNGHTGTYRSPSEARFAVLRAATNLKMNSTQIYQRMNDGRWPGLASLFSRYKNTMKALQADLHRLKNKGRQPGEGSVAKNNTSQPEAQGGQPSRRNPSFYEWLKTWRNAMHLKADPRGTSREGLQLKLVLRSIGEAASKSQSHLVEFGCRSLALATGLDHSTVSRHLRTLRSSPDALIRHVGPARGKNADVYELVIPAALEPSASAVSYRAGKIHALRPVFRVLGPVCAFVYEALEAGHSTVPQIVQATTISRSSVHEALSTLQAHHMAFHEGHTWVETGANLEFLAELLGATDAVAEQRARYVQERKLWVAWLMNCVSQVVMLSHEEDYPFELFEPPPDHLE